MNKFEFIGRVLQSIVDETGEEAVKFEIKFNERDVTINIANRSLEFKKENEVKIPIAIMHYTQHAIKIGCDIATKFIYET